MEAKLFERVPARRLGDIVYQNLVTAIASGQLADGTKLFEDEIARQMGVSKTPVREALRHLEKAGFVEADLHRTPVVRRLAREEINEIYRLREYLEALAVRLVAEDTAARGTSDLETIQQTMEARFARGPSVDVAASVEYNQKFHRALVTASGSRRLQAIMDPLWLQVHRLSFLSHHTYRLPGKQARAVAEHRAILDAIHSGDADRGEVLMREHIRHGHSDLVTSLISAGGGMG